MKSPRTRRSAKASPDDPRKAPGVTHVTRHRREVTARASANARAERERALVAREEAVARRERALRRQEAAVSASPPPTETRADIERLMGQLREANERLIVAAVQAQNLSDEAHTETAQARDELDDLLNQLRSSNERLAAGAAQAHALAEEARAREEEYRRLSSRLLTLQDEERRRLALDLHDPTGQRLAALTMNLDMPDGARGRSTPRRAGRSRRVEPWPRRVPERCERSRICCTPRCSKRRDCGRRCVGTRRASRSGAAFTWPWTWMRSGDCHGRSRQPSSASCRRVSRTSIVMRQPQPPRFGSWWSADVVALEIHDQGHGLRDRLAHQTGTLQPETLGVGIQGMRERIRQLGGTFDVEFTDQGTTVCVGLPLNADAP